MRTTLTIDDDIMAAARALARSQRRSLSAVISDLARKGLQPRPQASQDRGFPVFNVPDDAQPMTSDHVQAALDDE
jgi:hypothetical protein